ncbi:putative glycoside hydrolase [Haliangium ochraceum]|uniref:putative glycoside hydrolase n=1 Tax=Haliangium ochraceum TaxID=80816 RepID=UPI00019B9600|nr:putative glycoside hydrolase [Haliangium ochraceum]
MRWFLAGLIACIITCFGDGLHGDAALAAPNSNAPTTRRHYPTKLRPHTPQRFPDHGLDDRLSDTGRHARGIYVTPFYLNRHGVDGVAKELKRARLNAVVIDAKTDTGHILWPSDVPMSKAVQMPLIKDPRALIERFHEHGIYVIARIVCFKDDELPLVRPDLGVRSGSRGGRLFRAGSRWLDQYAGEVHDYLIALAMEWQRFGVDEIQLDYIRFPKGRGSQYAKWLHSNDQSPSRDALIAGFLERLDRAVEVPLSVDVFGLTTLVDGDPRGLGQTIEKMAPYVEAVSPMMYANGMVSYFKKGVITEHVYNLLHCGLWRARQKTDQASARKATGARDDAQRALRRVVLRPYLQSYPDSVPFFGQSFIQRQIEVAEQSGSEGFLFWNATMRNGTAYRAMRRMGGTLEQFGRSPERRRAEGPGDWCPADGEGDVFQSASK